MELNYFNIDEENQGNRLDRFLIQKFRTLSYINIQKLIRIGLFKVNKKKKNQTIN